MSVCSSARLFVSVPAAPSLIPIRILKQLPHARSQYERLSIVRELVELSLRRKPSEFAAATELLSFWVPCYRVFRFWRDLVRCFFFERAWTTARTRHSCLLHHSTSSTWSRRYRCCPPRSLVCTLASVVISSIITQ